MFYFTLSWAPDTFLNGLPDFHLSRVRSAPEVSCLISSPCSKPRSHEIMFACLQRDFKQCYDASGQGCWSKSMPFLNMPLTMKRCGIIALFGIFLETNKHQISQDSGALLQNCNLYLLQNCNLYLTDGLSLLISWWDI